MKPCLTTIYQWHIHVSAALIVYQRVKPLRVNDGLYFTVFHSDFMQPGLGTLQPLIDDLGNMDTVEPFQGKYIVNN